MVDFERRATRGRKVLKQMEGLLFKVFHLLVHHGHGGQP
jgi:hypothetical protein